MTHLFISRELPPAAYPPGGIGAYVDRMSRLLASRGETVHVIAHRWPGAPERRTTLYDGRLVIHRVALDESVADEPGDATRSARIRAGLLSSSCPAQTFSWQAALVTEGLIDEEGIDCIEAQEWEAPLYYFLLRRELGLSTSVRRPPCIVHLHSPSERIFAANGWDRSVADYAPMIAMEAYTIRNADALLSPSRFMAQEIIARDAVAADRITVIPLPMGEAPMIDRPPQVWSEGSICHVGRLEARKGIFEWTDALAMEAAAVTCEFVGGDTPLGPSGGRTVRQKLAATLPTALQRRCRFHGSRDRAFVREVMARSWAAVIPSRWENFPYSCVEAMASGLPVIASPHGGMRELIDDNVSGWIATDGSAPALAQALRRALETPPHLRAEMGAAAAQRAHAICDNDAVVAQHLAMRRTLVASCAADFQQAGPRDGRVGVVVAAAHSDDSLVSCLTSLKTQRQPPAQVRVVSAGSIAEPAAAFCQREGWRVTEAASGSFDAVCLTSFAAMLGEDATLGAVAYVDARAEVAPEFLSICARRLTNRRELLAGWTAEVETGRVHVPDTPSSPHRLHGRAGLHFAVTAAEMHRALSRFKTSASLIDVVDDLATRNPTRTYPAVLVTAPAHAIGSPRRRRYSSMARGIQRLHTPLLRWIIDGSPEDRRELLEQALRHPARSARQLTAPLARLLRSRVSRAVNVR